ncbi:hypothetical protein FK514_28905, partial [Klebsiella pneumoniae]|nr:hypothetical protein [Klebsiella pneumoniae]
MATSRVTQTLDDLQNAQNDLATYNSQLVSLQTQPERAGGLQGAGRAVAPVGAIDVCAADGLHVS